MAKSTGGVRFNLGLYVGNLSRSIGLRATPPVIINIIHPVIYVSLWLAVKEAPHRYGFVCFSESLALPAPRQGRHCVTHRSKERIPPVIKKDSVCALSYDGDLLNSRVLHHRGRRIGACRKLRHWRCRQVQRDLRPTSISILTGHTVRI